MALRQALLTVAIASTMYCGNQVRETIECENAIERFRPQKMVILEEELHRAQEHYYDTLSVLRRCNGNHECIEDTLPKANMARDRLDKTQISYDVFAKPFYNQPGIQKLQEKARPNLLYVIGATAMGTFSGLGAFVLFLGRYAALKREEEDGTRKQDDNRGEIR